MLFAIWSNCVRSWHSWVRRSLGHVIFSIYRSFIYPVTSYFTSFFHMAAYSKLKLVTSNKILFYLNFLELISLDFLFRMAQLIYRFSHPWFLLTFDSLCVFFLFPLLYYTSGTLSHFARSTIQCRDRCLSIYMSVYYMLYLLATISMRFHSAET